MDLAAWLRGLDLGQYEAAFRNNDIDAAVLPELTTEDLISIGVTSVGHRRKLLSAIAALRANDMPSDLTPLTAPSSSPISHHPLPGIDPGIAGDGGVRGEAERRQLTVMF